MAPVPVKFSATAVASAGMPLTPATLTVRVWPPPSGPPAVRVSATRAGVIGENRSPMLGW
ncbi:hypothetical protein DRB96_42550 [Streptomyces sp. ICC1]|nr:hypothetical protein DRB89_38195 [Streptomyces sp. ICC4]AWZ17621.1 hypothetical protein DRB96_42550 [Streptomyces sp. ICC1]